MPSEPPSSTYEVDIGLEFGHASFARRLIAYLLDYAFTLTLTFFFFGLVYRFGEIDYGDPDELKLFCLLMALFYNVMWIGYYTITTGDGGQSFGKMACDIKVVHPDGSHVSYLDAFVRAFGYLFSGLFLYIGYLLALVDSRGQTLHDKIAGTVVVEID